MTWYYCHHCGVTQERDFIWTCTTIHSIKGELTGACIMCNNCGKYIRWEHQIMADTEDELHDAVEMYLETKEFPRINND